MVYNAVEIIGLHSRFQKSLKLIKAIKLKVKLEIGATLYLVLTYFLIGRYFIKNDSDWKMYTFIAATCLSFGSLVFILTIGNISLNAVRQCMFFKKDVICKKNIKTRNLHICRPISGTFKPQLIFICIPTRYLVFH